MINPNQQALENWAGQNGITGSLEELCENAKTKEHFIAELAKAAKEKKVRRLSHLQLYSDHRHLFQLVFTCLPLFSPLPAERV